MANIGTIEAEVRADTSNLSSDSRRAKAVFKDLSKSIIKIMKNVALATGAAMLGVGVQSVKAAAMFEEVDAKFNTAFRGIEKSAGDMAEELANSYIMSRTESKRLLSDTGDLLKGFGFTSEKALNLSGNVQKLAADLASYNNLQGGATRASEILTKALLGERDSLIGVGVKISEADVKQRMMEKGLDKLAGTARMSARAMATYELILQQTKDAQGDVGRTSGSLVTQMKKIKTQFSDIAVVIGKALIPIVLLITTRISEFVKKNKPKIEELADKFETLLNEGWASGFNKLIVIPFKQGIIKMELFFLEFVREIFEKLRELSTFTIFGKEINLKPFEKSFDMLIKSVTGKRAELLKELWGLDEGKKIKTGDTSINAGTYTVTAMAPKKESSTKKAKINFNKYFDDIQTSASLISELGEKTKNSFLEISSGVIFGLNRISQAASNFSKGSGFFGKFIPGLNLVLGAVDIFQSLTGSNDVEDLGDNIATVGEESAKANKSLKEFASELFNVSEAINTDILRARTLSAFNQTVSGSINVVVETATGSVLSTTSHRVNSSTGTRVMV